jgi:hypothetical protein
VEASAGAGEEGERSAGSRNASREYRPDGRMVLGPMTPQATSTKATAALAIA